MFPGLQGGPLMHVIAGKAAAFGEALRPEFRAYQQAVLDNARVLGETLRELGCEIGQGWLFGRPVPAHRIDALVAEPADEHGTSLPLAC